MAKRAVRNATSRAKRNYKDDLREKLNSNSGDHNICRLARARLLVSLDESKIALALLVTNFEILEDGKSILRRYQRWNSAIRLRSLSYKRVPCAVHYSQRGGFCNSYDKNDTVASADGIPIEFWNIRELAGFAWLSSMVNQITGRRLLLQTWSTSTAVLM